MEAKPLDEKIVNIVSAMFSGLEKKSLNNSKKVPINSSDYSSYLKLIDANHVSCEVILSLANFQDENIRLDLQNFVNRDRIRVKTLKAAFTDTLSLFNEAQIKYVVIKSIRHYSFSSFSDFDFIIPSEQHRISALKILERSGYIFLRGRFAEEPYKCGCHKGDAQIDIYPRAAWNRMHAIETNLLFNRRKQITYEGVQTWIPSIEDELIILTSHSFSHAYIKLSEVFEALSILKENSIDWDYVIEKAQLYGTIHCFYFFFYTLNQLLIYFNRANNQVLAFLKLLNENSFIRLVQKSIGNTNKIQFPRRFPTPLIPYSFSYRMYHDLKYTNLNGASDDVQTHLLMTVLRFLDNLGINMPKFSPPRKWSMEKQKLVG